MAKKILFTAVLIIFLAAVYSRGNAKDVPLKEIESALIKEPTFHAMEKSGDRQLLQFLDLDPESFSEYVYYRGTEALSAEELLIVKAAGKEDMSAVKDAVDRRVAEQTKLFESYVPKQVAMLKNAVILTKGHYLFYCAGENAERYKEVFLHAVQ